MKKFMLLFFFALLSFTILNAQNFTEISPVLQNNGNQNNNPVTIWNVQFDWNAQTATGNLGNAGAVFIPTLNQFWTSRWATTTGNAGKIHIWNKSGVVIDSFVTPFTGTRGMAFDGQFVYHSTATNTVQKVDPVTRQVVGTITLPATVPNGARYITFDPTADGGQGGFWVGNWTAPNLNIYLVSRTGTLLRTINNAITGIYGIAFDKYSAGGPFLWVWGQGAGAGTPQLIQQLDYNTGLPTGVQHDVTLEVGLGNTQAIAGALFISEGIVPGYATIGGMLQGTPDKLFGYELKGLDAGVLQPFNLTAPAASVTITTLPNSTETVTFNWDTSRAGATYKWIFGSPNATSRQIVKDLGTNSWTITLGELDNILAGLGVTPNQSLTGQWDVWAFRGNMPQNDSLKATNGPRAIVLKRGLPALTSFNLVNPENSSTITTSVFNSGPVVFNWTKSGTGTKYNMRFGTTLTTPLIVYPSNNSGFDTTWTIANNALDLVLANAGLNPGDQLVGVWSVYASNGVDSVKALQTWNLTMKRQAKGDWLVAYDSTSTNGRLCKDSLSYYMGVLGKTFDLFNRKGNTNASSISFNGYKGLIWLGSNTSVMSLVQKDSIKSYLLSGGTTVDTKSKLIIFGEDVGYQLDRTASTYYDSSFAHEWLGFAYIADYPGGASGGRGIIGDVVNNNMIDSTMNTFPDHLQPSWLGSDRLYKFRITADATGNAFGLTNKPTYNAATFGLDIYSLRNAVDGLPGSPILRLLSGAITYVAPVPVELTSFTANVSKDKINLLWVTATETNNSGFAVERKSENSGFEQVAFISGKGTTTEMQTYSYSDKVKEGNYTYRLKQVDFDGTTNYSKELNVSTITPTVYALEQNYPNPFNPSTVIKYSIPQDGLVSLQVFNVLGEKVMTLVNENMKAGKYEVKFNASSFASGIYLYRLESGSFVSVKKMLLIK